MRFPWVIASFVAVIILTSCQQNGTAIAPEHNRSGKPITITVYEYKTHAEVSNALRQFQKSLEQPVTKETSLGWSGWDKEEPYQCEIHIKPPKYVDDDDTLTLGHELAHCLYGSYHR